MSSIPSPHFTEEIFSLWQQLAEFPASETDAALRRMQEWLVQTIEASNVIWIGALRVLRGARAKEDPFFGWRVRARQPFLPDPEAYRQVLASYYTPDHYGKLTPTYYDRSHEGKDVHVGMTGRASLAGAGRFRVHRLRDRDWIDYAAFKRTAHYRLYYDQPGIVDRMTIGFPVSPDAESFLLIDRYRQSGAGRTRPFNDHEAALAGAAARGIPALHRRLLLGHGLLAGNKLLSPTERQILRGLLTDQTEKELATALDLKPATLHKYVVALYARFEVRSRAGLMALWLS